MSSAPGSVSAAGSATEDKRLDRMLDYTKFHIGVYLSIGGGIAGLISVAASEDGMALLKSLVGCPVALALALLAMVVAGFAGGVIASSCAQSATFTDLWDKKQGPWDREWWTGRIWARIEHTSFWISLSLLAYGILSAPAVRIWVQGGR